jgi:hypothetical protein
MCSVDRWNICRVGEHHSRPICGTGLGHTIVIKNVLKIHTEVKIKKSRYNIDENLVILQLQHENEK